MRTADDLVGLRADCAAHLVRAGHVPYERTRVAAVTATADWIERSEDVPSPVGRDLGPITGGVLMLEQTRAQDAEERALRVGDDPTYWSAVAETVAWVRGVLRVPPIL